MSYIEADELVKIYKTDDSEVFALQGLDMQIEKGEMITVVGKSGSGKSTLMSLIGCLETPSAGKLTVNGESIIAKSRRQADKYRRKNVGFVWQMCSKNLMPYLTASENIEVMIEKPMSRKAKKEKAAQLLDMVGLKGKENSLPHQMSGGEQQRVAIAVAICNEPKILLADEPTGAVDAATCNQIWQLFEKLNKELGITILIVTHDLSLAERANRTVYISDGKISTEKVKTESSDDSLQDEYSVLDKAGRLKLNDELLETAGIVGKRVRVTAVDGKIIIENADVN